MGQRSALLERSERASLTGGLTLARRSEGKAEIWKEQ